MTIPKLPGTMAETVAYWLGADQMGRIVEAIPDGYQVIAPVEQKWAVNLAPIRSADELALGVEVEEGRAKYRLSSNPLSSDFSRARPMNSPKSFHFKARQLLYKTVRSHQSGATGSGEDGYIEAPPAAAKKAFFGLSACDVTGIYVLDRTFQGRYSDPAYERERADTIIIGQNCLTPGNNCFCSTFDAGPGLKGGFDIGLTSLNGDYLAEAATERGVEIMTGSGAKPAPPEMVEKKAEGLNKARGRMEKAFDLNKALRTLNDNYDHPYWNEPSERCLSCANCINVCPTCYCYRVEEKTSADLGLSTRTRVWDACQHLEFAAVHGGNFRPERVDRIRQWVNHKINWTIEQYGCSGCVGCGRCITWCPTAIDITEPVWRLGGKDIGLAV